MLQESFSNCERGGEGMVEETIKTIKETENEAEEIIKKADATCTTLLEEAEASAKEMKEKAETQAKEKAQAALNAAKEAGEHSMQEALGQVEGEIADLKKAAETKEAEAIAAVIAGLV